MCKWKLQLQSFSVSKSAEKMVTIVHNFQRFKLNFNARIVVLLAITLIVISCKSTVQFNDYIHPYDGNPYYWQYKGNPVLLLGGSWQDNLFNHPVGLERHLDLLLESGGNYVRNTMSHRNTGNVFAYSQKDGKFDLDRFNEEYWQRFENFLTMTRDRDIIVQIEVFDPWDLFEDHEAQGGWSLHPYNPANNITYTAAESGLPTDADYAPAGSPSDHTFYYTVPALHDNQLVLVYQQAFVDRLLSISLEYPNVIYSIQNETGEELAFGDYWADYIHQKAEDTGRTVYVTDMRRNADLTASDHYHTYDNAERFNFLDVSQNNWMTGQHHYNQIIYVRDYISEAPRPINNVKIYNRDGDEESMARFFRIIFAGGASARFHRPAFRDDLDAQEISTSWGLGLGPLAQTTIRSGRMFEDAFNVFASQPDNELLSERDDNEAYVLVNPGQQYAVYFPDGGEVILDVSSIHGSLELRWLDINNSTWLDTQYAEGGGGITLQAPGSGHWAVVIEID